MFESIDKYMRSHVDIDDLFESVKYKRSFRKANPTYFDPDGILVFCGPQGSGKTLSAVRYVLDLLRAFPHAILCSNVKIYGLPDSVRYVQYTGLDCFDKYNNGFEGVIFLIDEIHIEFAGKQEYACFHYYRDRSAAKAAQAYCRYFTGVRPYCKAFPGAIQVCGSVQNVLRLDVF